LNKALLDTDISSEILKAVDQTVTRNAIAYRQFHGILTVSAVIVMKIVRGFQRNQSHRTLQKFLAAVALEEVLAFTGPTASWPVASPATWSGPAIPSASSTR
jgi:tRNA(fMet)-specific endonuclease VapC